MGKNLTSFSTTLFCKKKKKKTGKTSGEPAPSSFFPFYLFKSVQLTHTHAPPHTQRERDKHEQLKERGPERGDGRAKERGTGERTASKNASPLPPPPPPTPLLQPHRRSPSLLPRPPARALGRAPLQARVVPGRDLVRRRADRALAGLGARVLLGRAADGDARLRGRVAREAAHAAEQARGGADALADEGGVGGVVDGAVSTFFFFF